MSSAIFLWLIPWLVLLSAIAFANLVFSIEKMCTIIRDMMSRTFSRKLSEDERKGILKRMDDVLQLRGFIDLGAYLDEYYPGEFSGTKRERRLRISNLKEIQFLTFLIDFADDLGCTLDYIFRKIGPPMPLSRTPKIKK